MRKLLLTSAVVSLAVVGTALANNTTPSTATDIPPIVEQVGNHEQRIGDLETKTDNTQTQVNQNTADIGVLQTNTGSSSAPQVERVQTPVTYYQNTGGSTPTTPAPTPPEPTPVEPEPVPDPPKPTGYIYSVQDVPKSNGTHHECRYVIEERPGFNTPTVSQPNAYPCQQPGEILTGVN